MNDTPIIRARSRAEIRPAHRCPAASYARRGRRLRMPPLSLLLIPSGAETAVFWAPQRLASLVAPTRRDDLKLSRGATAKARENAVKQDHAQVTNTFGITRKGQDSRAGRN